MKTTFILSVICILWSFGITTTAQNISNHSIGLRIGDNNGLGTEVSYQKHLKSNRRIEANLGWRNSNSINAFKLSALYQWVQPIDNDFNWYYGAGGGIGAFNTDDTDGTFALIAGDIGLEYDFDFPLLLSLDFRPELGFNSRFNNGLNFDIALGVRYQF